MPPPNKTRISPFLLYFANSSSGGGAVRFGHYRRLMTKEEYTFVAHTNVGHGFQKEDSRVIQVRPSYYQRFLNENKIIQDMDLRDTLVFSHGAPLIPKSKAYILHLNNTLPLVADEVDLDFSLRLKMKLLGRRLKEAAKRANLLTVESHATMDLVQRLWGKEYSDKCRILTNGVDPIEDRFLKEVKSIRRPYALSIGTYPYKRIDLVKDAFRELRSNFSNVSLAILGTVDGHPENGDNIQSFSQLDYLESRWLIANCEFYITMSQTENCSISLLEAMHHRKKIICSPIASHVEFLNKYGYISTAWGSNQLLCYPSDSMDVLVPTWREIVSDTYLVFEDCSRLLFI